MWRAPAVAPLLLALAGCADASFEARYEQGISDLHTQVSPRWEDPGWYQQLPAGGPHRGFRLETVQGAEAVVTLMSPDDPAPSTPSAIAFQDPDLDAAWGAGTYGLGFVRRGDIPRPGDESTATSWWVQFDPTSLGGSFGPDISPDARDAALLDLAHMVVPPDQARSVADRLQRSCRPSDVPGLEQHQACAFTWNGPSRTGDRFRELGGLRSATLTIPGTPQLTLPYYGQADLQVGDWRFSLSTLTKGLSRGGFADHEIVWLQPDGSAWYTHGGEDKLSDRQAARRAEQALRDLGRPIPDTVGWTFTHERSEGGPG